MRTSLYLLVGVVGVTMMTTPAAANPPIKVAVVPGIAVNLDAAKVDALSQDLADALASELLVTAAGGLEVRRELPPEGVAPDCVTTPSCVADVARKLGASQLLFVVMVDTGSGGSIQIDSTWVDVATNRTASRPPIDIASPTVARARFVDAAHQLLPDAPLRPKPKHDTLAGGKPRHLTTPSILTGAAGIIGLGVGIGFGLDARSKYNSCNADGVACTDERRTSIRHVALVADGGFFLAIAGAIATGLIYTGSAESPHVIVAPTPDGVTVGAVGKF
jgi:hypothetical protein